MPPNIIIRGFDRRSWGLYAPEAPNHMMEDCAVHASDQNIMQRLLRHYISSADTLS